MFLLENDCTLYKMDKSVSFKNISSSQKNKRYERLKIEEINHEVIKISYTWFDPVKVQDKIISNDPITITFVHYLDGGYIFCFGSSESYVSYAVSKMEQKLNIDLQRISVFEIVKDFLIHNRIWFAKPVSLNLVDALYEDKKNITLKEIRNNNLNLSTYFEKYVVTCITCYIKELNLYFYVDCESVLSFPDNVKEEVVYNVLEKFIRLY